MKIIFKILAISIIASTIISCQSERKEKFLQGKVKISQKAYNLSKKQYEQGLITQNEHLNSVNDLEKAQLDEIQAIYNQRLAAFNYLQTTGSIDINNLK